MEFVEILRRDLAAAKEREAGMLKLLEQLGQQTQQVTANIYAVRGEIAYCERKLAEREPQSSTLKLADPTLPPDGETELEQLDRVAKGDLRPGDPGYAEARRRDAEALGKFGKEVGSPPAG